MLSGGLAMSAMLAMLIPHLNVGAQKWTVFQETPQSILLHDKQIPDFTLEHTS